MGLLTMRDLAGFGSDDEQVVRPPPGGEWLRSPIFSPTALAPWFRIPAQDPLLKHPDLRPANDRRGPDASPPGTTDWLRRLEAQGYAEDQRAQEVERRRRDRAERLRLNLPLDPVTPGVSRDSSTAIGPSSARTLSYDEYARLKRSDPELLRDWLQSGRYSPPADLWREDSGGPSPGMESRRQQQEAWEHGTTIKRTFTDQLPGVGFEQAARLAADRARAAAEDADKPAVRAQRLEDALAYDKEAARLAAGGVARPGVPVKRSVRWDETTSGQDAEIQQREMERRGVRTVRPPGWDPRANEAYREAEQRRQADDRRLERQARQDRERVERELKHQQRLEELRVAREAAMAQAAAAAAKAQEQQAFLQDVQRAQAAFARGAPQEARMPASIQQWRTDAAARRTDEALAAADARAEARERVENQARAEAVRAAQAKARDQEQQRQASAAYQGWSPAALRLVQEEQVARGIPAGVPAAPRVAPYAALLYARQATQGAQAGGRSFAPRTLFTRTGI